MKTFCPVNTKAFISAKHYNIFVDVIECVLPALAPWRLYWSLQGKQGKAGNTLKWENEIAGLWFVQFTELKKLNRCVANIQF